MLRSYRDVLFHANGWNIAFTECFLEYVSSKWVGSTAVYSHPLSGSADDNSARIANCISELQPRAVNIQ
jgi:hypothetical protein